jgi:hypothetical protein
MSHKDLVPFNRGNQALVPSTNKPATEALSLRMNEFLPQLNGPKPPVNLDADGEIISPCAFLIYVHGAYLKAASLLQAYNNSNRST